MPRSLSSARRCFLSCSTTCSARAIDQKDRDVIEARLHEYVAIYEGGGLPALQNWIQRVSEARKQQTFFVRVAQPDRTVNSWCCRTIGSRTTWSA